MIQASDLKSFTTVELQRIIVALHNGVHCGGIRSARFRCAGTRLDRAYLVRNHTQNRAGSATRHEHGSSVVPHSYRVTGGIVSDIAH